MKCRFCGEEHDSLFHECDGRQGHVEAHEPLAPYDPHENVRTSDPDTSHAAAASVSVTVPQQRVHDILEDHPLGLTHQQLLRIYVERHGLTAESTPRKRCCDLVKIGRVVDSGERRLLEDGKHYGIVWRLTRYHVTSAA